MSNFPTLFDLALDAVVDCFEIGILPTNHIKVSPEVQEKIFKTVMQIREYCYNDHTKELIETFQPRKLQLNFGKIEEGTFAEIQQLKLTELKIQNFEWISKYREPRTEQEGSNAPRSYIFRIGRFLNNISSPETKEDLRVLDISGTESFGDNWMEEISSMFPNLEVLNIGKRRMSEADFTSLCNNLSNLRSLNIGGTRIKNLNGLAKLQNLKYLNINDLRFETKEDIKDIFELKQLKHLAVGNHSSSPSDWCFEKPLLQLELFECHWEYADDAFLQKILPNLPRLQTVVAYKTHRMHAAAHPSVSVYTGGSVENMMKTIGYFRSQNDWEKVNELFWHFNDFYSVWLEIEDEENTPQLITSMVDELDAVICDFKLSRRVLPHPVEWFLLKLPEFIDQGTRLNADKLKVIDMLLMDLRHGLKKRNRPDPFIFKFLWDGIGTLIKITEYFHTDQICSLAMKSIIHDRGFHDWKPVCVLVLDTLLDRMDLASKYYKKTNFRKISQRLRTIQKKAYLLPEHRASAVNVLRFVELFM